MFDCYAPAPWGEQCSCFHGRARVLDISEWEGTQLYHYTCCDNGETVGENCGYQPPWLLPLLIILPCVYASSWAFMICWYRDAKQRARGVPTTGYCTTPENAIDIPADSLAYEAGFRSMGAAGNMPAGLEGFMSREEYAMAFEGLTRQLRQQLGFRWWHLLLWAVMIAFWPIGGFMFFFLGIWRARWAAVACAGAAIGPACEKAGLRYVFIPMGGGEHGGRHPSIVRFLLPAGAAIPLQPIQGQVPMAMAVPMHQAAATHLHPAGDPAARIQQLKGLLDSGAITQADYDAKKAELLAQM